MGRTLVAVVCALAVAACDPSALGLSGRDGGSDARADALGPVPVIFSTVDEPSRSPADDASYSLKR